MAVSTIKDLSSHGQLGRWRAGMLVLTLAVLGFTVFDKTLYTLAVAVLDRQDSSHGIFVPFISAYLIWLRVDELKATKLAFAPLSGALLLSFGLVLAFLSGRSSLLQAVSFFIVAAGAVLAVFGPLFFKKVSFPFLFLISMVPLPEAWYAQIAEWMRQAITWGSVTFLHAVGFPIFREGFNIRLPQIDLHVSHACSGIRHLLSFFVFGIAYAFRFKQSRTARVFVVASAIPLSVFSGTLRLCLIFLMAHYIDPFFAEHRPHVVLGWIMFMVVLAGAIALDQVLQKKKEMGGQGEGRI